MVGLWERASQQHPLARALHLLAAHPGDGREAATRDQPDLAQLGEVPIGERNRRLMSLFAANFGHQLGCESRCPRCAELVEFTMDLRLILAERPGEEAPYQVEVDGYAVRFRLPSTLDLLAVARCGSAAAGRAVLFDRCVVEALRDGAVVATAALPAPVLELLARRMSDCDPHTETRVRLECPECDNEWRVMVDIAEMLWARVANRARRTTHAVHVLASSYGWSEADILAMSDTRRALYLSMVGA
ncbi:hypothetical protein [Haliangium sp.]|uniref:T4 family baseplate hub assembly chaperone n=1 Tax=Haliangium sp. TaxID=2663208 RepID=UPI003D1177FE